MYFRTNSFTDTAVRYIVCVACGDKALPTCMQPVCLPVVVHAAQSCVCGRLCTGGIPSDNPQHIVSVTAGRLTGGATQSEQLLEKCLQM
jgi:hypothetical protein